MRTILRRIGNSTGMVLPKMLLAETELAAGAVLDMRVVDGKLVADPILSLRSGWAEAAARVSKAPSIQEEQEWLGVS